jgi:peptidoglycan/LPS O-acetylase OafA/YrhL
VGALPQEGAIDRVEGYRPPYRADIDGLRAIAVVAVIVYHFWERALPGGFLGVDVFFVISGFLITRILVRESEAGDYSIARFYDRRIRRIMPALLAVIAASIGAAWLLFLAADARPFAESVVATLGFGSNIHFWLEGINYFAPGSEAKPLLHTWSLGIEEQFYIVFPVLLLGLLKLGGRRAALWGIAAVIPLSFGFSILTDAIGRHHEAVAWLSAGAWSVDTAAFYLLPMRAWELALGGGIALFRDEAPLPRGRFLVAVGAFAMLTASLTVLQPSSFGWLPPATFAFIATAALIWSGQRTTPVARLLGARPLVGVGLISYSLYLWHWPIAVFGRYYLIREPTSLERLGMLLLTAAVATVSWRFVERPFRGHRLPTRRMLAIVAAATVVLGGAAVAIRLDQGVPGRLPRPAAAFDEVVRTPPYFCSPEDDGRIRGFDACPLGYRGDIASADVVLFGNSHARMYVPALSAVLGRRHLRGALLANYGCLPVTQFNYGPDCTAQARAGVGALLRLPARTVIIATKWPAEDEVLFDEAGHPAGNATPARYLAALQGTIDRLERAGKRVVVIGPVPEPGYPPTRLAARELMLRGRIETPMQQSRATYDARFGAFERGLAMIAPQTTVLLPSDLLCDATRCTYVLQETPVFLDDNHLSEVVMPAFEPLFERALDEAMPRRGEVGVK